MQAIDNHSVQQLIENQLIGAQAEVQGDGYKYQITVISPTFNGKNTVHRHKQVYVALNAEITSGALHAITLKTYTPDEWAQTIK